MMHFFRCFVVANIFSYWWATIKSCEQAINFIKHASNRCIRCTSSVQWPFVFHVWHRKTLFNIHNRGVFNGFSCRYFKNIRIGMPTLDTQIPYSCKSLYVSHWVSEMRLRPFCNSNCEYFNDFFDGKTKLASWATFAFPPFFFSSSFATIVVITLAT